MSDEKKISGAKRAEKMRKKRYGPTGPGFSAQRKRAEVNKWYQGVPQALRPEINIIDETKRKKGK